MFGHYISKILKLLLWFVLYNRAATWERTTQQTVSAQRFCWWPANPTYFYTTLRRIGSNSQCFYGSRNYILTNMYVWAARNLYLYIHYEPNSIKRARWDRIRMPVSAQWLHRWPVSPPHIISAYSSWQLINRQCLITANVQSQACMKYKSWWKLELSTGSFWEYK
jgi:hypothetical protein